MKARRLSVALVVPALLLAFAPAALAKGANAATIEGPGLEHPITLRGLGEPGADTRLAKLADQAGLFAAMFGDTSAGQLSGVPPGGALGPRYTITYAVPGDGGAFPVVQDLYPYAAGGPVTHAQPGQRLWGGQQVVGGWFRGPASLLPMLVSLGLPSGPPSGSATAARPSSAGPLTPVAAGTARGGSGWWIGSGAGIGGVLLLVVAVLAVRSVRGRRPQGGSGPR
jgi:hypothetical protein